MQALKLEHADIRKSLDGLQSTLSAIKLKESRSEQLLTSRWSIQQKLDDLRQLIEGHASREEVILHMAKRALGDKAGQSGS
jgi:predicted  nucleic acid-binding Zn-ribbon protein